MVDLLGKLGMEIVNSPFLSIMILNRDNEIVWHNERFARDFDLGADLVGKKCYHVTGNESVHAFCPLDESINYGKRMKGFLDFGDTNFYFFTVPLDENHAAKIHVFLPKEPDNKMVSE